MTIPMTAAAVRTWTGWALIALGGLCLVLGAPHDLAWAIVSLGAAALDPKRPIPGRTLSQAEAMTMDTQDAGEAGTNTADAGAGADVVQGAGSDSSAPALHPAHAAIIQVAHATSAPAEDWATRAAEAISEADPLIQAGAQLGRASPKTSAYIALGELAVPVIAKILQKFWPHPKAAGATA